MNKFYVICSVPLFLFAVIFLYFTIVRKNTFEKRLTLFRPTQRLSQKRETYMQGVHKYSKYVNIILLVIFYLPLCIFMAMMLKEEYETNFLCAYFIAALPCYLCNKAQRKSPANAGRTNE